MLSEPDTEPDHFTPSLRVLELPKQTATGYGFHLTRSKWDPYPWVSAVDADSPAGIAGVAPGDCLLQVNGEDVVGRRVSDIAELVKKRVEVMTLLLWNAGASALCTPETLCCGPMPKNLQRLSACMSSILTFLECPICLDTIPPPAYQCDNGHLMCMRCRAKSERCPVCRTRLSKARCLLADQISNTLVTAFEIKKGAGKCNELQRIFKIPHKNKNVVPDIKVTHANKFLAKCREKSTSLDNLNSSAKGNASLGVDEFGANLKAKSLSSNEIFCCGVSRATSVCNVDRFCSNSFECLSRTTGNEGGEKFYCPYEENCAGLLRSKTDFLEHFKSSHTGPLIQYLTHKVTVPLADVNSKKHFSCTIEAEGKTFYLSTSKIADSGTLLWIWILGDRKTAHEYSFQIDIADEENNERVFLRLRTEILPLTDFSWSEIVSSRKGIYLNGETVVALRNACESLVLNVVIVKDVR